MLSAHRAWMVIGIAAATACTGVRADPVLDYTLGVEVEHDSNVNLSRTDPVSQNILTPELTFGVKEQGSTLTADVAGTLQYRDYLGNAFGDEFRSLLSGVVDWSISPGRFDWVFEDYLGRQPVNVLASDAPTNQQQTNVFSTGPTLRAHFSDTLRGKLDLRYTNTYADTTTDFNGDRLSAAAQLAYLFSLQSNIAAATTAAQVRYDDAASKLFEYDRYDVYAGYHDETRALKFDLAAGYSWLNFLHQSDDSGLLLRANAAWTPSATTTLGINASREFSDASQDLIVDPSQLGNLGVGSGRNGAVVSPQVYVSEQVGFDFAHTQGDFRFDVAPFWRHIDYVGGNTLNQRSYGYIASVDWILRPTITLSAGAGREHRDYSDLSRTDDDKAYWLGLLWQQARHWSWRFRAANLSRDSTVFDSGYSDRAYTVSLTYTR
jgi:hypothetical protein